jgi:hypothetical protein
MPANVKYFILIIGLAGGLLHCNSSDTGKYNVDISDVQVDLQINRFEQDLFALSPKEIDQGFEQLQQQYPRFFPIYIEKIMGLGPMEDSILRKQPELPGKYKENLRIFLANEYVQNLYDTCQAHYPDMEPIEQDLEKSFRYLKYYFPDTQVPAGYTFISEFGFGAITADSILGIGLDMFLGSNYRYYGSVGVGSYMTGRVKGACIMPSAIKGWLQHKCPYKPAKQELVEEMVDSGEVVRMVGREVAESPDEVEIE